MTSECETSDEWSACPEGTLAKLAGRLRAKRRRTVALRAACAVGLAAVLLSLAVLLPKRHAADDFFHGGLYCSQVRPALPDYRAGKLKGKFLGQVERHLAECEPCRQVLKELEKNSAEADQARFHRPFVPAPGPIVSQLTDQSAVSHNNLSDRR
jgi:predicted anti-sigma-YlaC factor YlaD